MGAYLCIASNGIPPSVSKRVVLIVNCKSKKKKANQKHTHTYDSIKTSAFAVPPAIWVRQDAVYAAFGQKVTLECITEAYPNSINYWTHGSSQVPGGTFESVTMENVFKVIMQLVVRPHQLADFGAYRCVGQNSLGESERMVYLHRRFFGDFVLPIYNTKHTDTC